MEMILKDAFKTQRHALIGILCLNFLTALATSLSTLMLAPMLELLNIDMTGGTMDLLLKPLAALSMEKRTMLIIALFVGITVLRALLTRAATVQQNTFLESYERSLRDRLYKAITEADWQTLSRKKQGDLTALFLMQSRQVRQCLQRILAIFASVVSAAMQLAIACMLSLPLTAVVLLVGGGFLLAFRPFQKRSRAYGQKSVENSRAMYQEILNQLDSIKETRAYGVEKENRELYESVNQEYYDISLQTTQLQVLPQLCYSIAAAVLIALAFVFSVFVLETDTARIMILVYIFSRLWPVFSSWQAQLQMIATSVPAFSTICEALDSLKSAAQTVKTEGEMNFEEEITFSHIGFTYRNAEEPVLNDVSFTLPYGSVTALAGRSGAGKSTTADLLLGLLEPTVGEIRIDGVVLCPKNIHAWRRNLGYVPQSPLIIDDTVRENLRRFHPDATEAEMIEALKAALAWPVIEKLENGLDTVLGAKGVRLSGGEKQRIVLARVLLGNPRLIILDEATSALDYESEAQIAQTIQTLRGKTTVLIIAHRLATIRSADRAVVLADRGVAESGSLEELLTKEDGYLARMVTVE